MLEYRLCLLLQLWCLTVMYLYVRVSSLSLLQLWCLTVMYLYVGVSSLSSSTIVMFDGHVFVCWSIVFASFYNCDVWRSCICMLEYRLCLLLQLWCVTVMYLYGGVSSLSLLQLWCLTVMYIYVRVSSLSPSTIVMFDGHVFVCWSIVFVSFYNCDVWRSCICMLEYRLCLLLQLWCLTVMYLYVRVSSLSLLQLWCLTVMYLYVRVSSLSLLQLWCLTVMYLYVGVSSLPPSTIVIFDGHLFVC